MNVRLFINYIAAMTLCQTAAAQVNEGLKKLGMENIQYVNTEDGSITAFEDRVFRNSYYGVGKAIETALNEQNSGYICLIITDNNGIPQLKIFIDRTTVEDYASGRTGIEGVYRKMSLTSSADKEINLIKGHKTEKRSAWRPDFTVYPYLFLENTRLDVLYSYVISLAPTLQMPLWKGANMNAQVIFPVVGNRGGEIKTIRPGFVSITQNLYFKKNWYLKVSGGLFDNNRMGGNAELMWRSPKGRWEVGGKAGATVWSYFEKDGWFTTRKPKIDASVFARTYIPVWNTEIYASANRFVYGDYGMSGEIIRHFGEYTVGLYAVMADGDINGGFSFAIPLPGKKYNRWKGVRIKPSDYFTMKYSMVAWGEYIDRKLGHTYHTSPDENRSHGFYQPDYIKYFLIKSSEKNKPHKKKR